MNLSKEEILFIMGIILLFVIVAFILAPIIEHLYNLWIDYIDNKLNKHKDGK
jgi:hypothetical protein